MAASPMAPTARKPAKDCVQCPYCDHPPVKTASTLRGHVAKAHGLTDSFACPYPPCKFITAQLRYMVRHVDNIHEGALSTAKSGAAGGGVVGTFYCCDCTFSSKSQDELRRHMFDKHPKPGDETVVFPSQAMDPEHLLDTEDTENPAPGDNGGGDDDDDEGNLLIDEGEGGAGEDVTVAGGGGALVCPPELLDIAVALNEDRIIVPPVGKSWQQYQPPQQPPPAAQEVAETLVAPPGEATKRKTPSILRRKSNNAKKPKTEEDIGGVLQQQQQQPLRCPLCPTTVIDMDALELHIRSVHQAAEEEPAPADVTPFPLSQAPRAQGKSCCLFCTAFSTVDGDSAMDHHVRTAHPETVYLKCSDCTFRTWSSDILNKHDARHHSRNRQPATLLGAPQPVSTPKAVIKTPPAVSVPAPAYDAKEAASFDGGPEVKCTVKGCRFSSSNPAERDHHLKVKHQTRVSYKCAAAGCEFMSLEAADMRRHMALEHVLVVKNKDGTETRKKISDQRDPPYPGNPLLQSKGASSA